MTETQLKLPQCNVWKAASNMTAGCNNKERHLLTGKGGKVSLWMLILQRINECYTTSCVWQGPCLRPHVTKADSDHAESADSKVPPSAQLHEGILLHVTLHFLLPLKKHFKFLQYAA